MLSQADIFWLRYIILAALAPFSELTRLGGLIFERIPMYVEALYGQHEEGGNTFATFVFFRVKMRHTMCRFRVRGPHPICLCKKVGVAHRWCRRTCHTWVQGREIDLQRTFRSILCSTVKSPPLNTEHVLEPRELGLPPSFRSSISMVRTTRPHAAISTTICTAKPRALPPFSPRMHVVVAQSLGEDRHPSCSCP